MCKYVHLDGVLSAVCLTHQYHDCGEKKTRKTKKIKQHPTFIKDITTEDSERQYVFVTVVMFYYIINLSLSLSQIHMALDHVLGLPHQN